MTEDQLRYFVTIVDTGSYTQTAIELNISQSSISKQIKALERELGVRLFNRQRRYVELTEIGEKLLPQVRLTLEEINSLTSMASKLRIGNENRITVLTLPFMSYSDFSIPIGRFELENPHCRIEMIELEEPELFQKILGNNFDIALTYWHEKNIVKSKNYFDPSAVDEVVLAVHKDSSLAKLEYVMPNQLKDTPLMLMEPYTCISNLCITFFDEHGVVPNIISRGRPETILSCVEIKRGAALIPRRLANHLLVKNVVLIPFEPSISAVQGVVTNKESQKNSKIKELVNMLISKDNE